MKNMCQNALNNSSSSDTSVKYLPGKVPERPAASANVEQYIPPEVSTVVSNKPKYIPSLATSKKTQPSETRRRSPSRHPPQREAKRGESRKENATKPTNQIKRTHSADMFGSDDDDTEEKLSGSTKSYVSTRSCGMKPPSVGQTVNKTRSANPTNKSSVPNKKRLKSSPSNAVSSSTSSETPPLLKPARKLLNPEELKEFMDTKDRAIQEMHKLNELLKPEVLPDVEIVTLKHLTERHLEHRFKEHKSNLTMLFDAYCKQKVRNTT